MHHPPHSLATTDSGDTPEPYLYLLPGMEEIWQSRFVEDFMRRLAQDEEGAGPP